MMYFILFAILGVPLIGAGLFAYTAIRLWLQDRFSK